MRRILLWWIGLVFAASLFAGCSAPKYDHEKYSRIFSAKEGTVTGLEDGLSAGLEWVSWEMFTDNEGRQHFGLLARISVSANGMEQAESIEVYRGSVFQVGDRSFEVLDLKPNTSLGLAPGSSNGSIVIGELRSNDPLETIESPRRGRTLVITDVAARLCDDKLTPAYVSAA